MPQGNPPAGLIPYRKLVWKDFPIRDDVGKPHELARTEGRILWQYRSRWSEEKRGVFVARVASVELSAHFDTRRSWRRSRLIGQDEGRLLAHEQAHLDLTQLAMLNLRRVPLEQLGVGSGESGGAALADLDDKVKNYFEAALKEHQRVQDRFDAETDHGRNLLAELSWEKKLARALADLGSTRPS